MRMKLPDVFATADGVKRLKAKTSMQVNTPVNVQTPGGNRSVIKSINSSDSRKLEFDSLRSSAIVNPEELYAT